MSASEISQELAQRMAECLRAYANGKGAEFSQRHGKSVFAEATDIVTELPKPMDPDIEEARLILRARFWCTDDIWAEDLNTTRIYRAIKRGRELERSGK